MITSQSIETESVEETFAVGERLATQLQPGNVLGLSGELGAGKTSLVKGIARGLGISQEVTSPTFTLIHEHSGGRLPLFHIDLYRLETSGQALAIGIEDYLNPSGVTVIEWAEKVRKLLPEGTNWIRVVTLSETRRRIEIA
ncbi:MAG TPA: tRNA (adenosine(37)-N6)-threonylcarbamoyltransferase complex ATPase subunit type 1 TsaE [Verrucomicrobiae bacterium]|nr:tRNA (adenosine(37)-N6)-threonylcarbamoyltransferase complex ATPase subunit type 1 TsaE [Verrucomicrobiae bacterium]